MNINDLFSNRPFSLDDEQKATLLKPALAGALNHHYRACPPFRRFCEKKNFDPSNTDFDYADLPYLPVGIFKQMRLSSVVDSSVVRTVQSSATSSQTPSTIIIDDVTRRRQMKCLLWLMSDYLGNDRRPFVVLDVDPNKIPAGEQTISARTAAMRGFLTMSSSAVYCMDSDSSGKLAIDLDKFRAVLSEIEAEQQKVVLFGYTYVLYINVVKELLDNGIRFSLNDATILHIGGWKKLLSQAVVKSEFNAALSKVFGVQNSQIIDAYGFTEQLGLLYMDCSEGVKHCPLLSEIIVRDQHTLEPLPDGRAGMVELITPLPYSYPGVAILLDDIGKIVRRGKCPCGRNGTAFEILGRAKTAEIRGCGDILAQKIVTRA